MGNKFIPLEKRESLLISINKLRASYRLPSMPVEKHFNWVPIISWLLSGLGAIISVVGATSLVGKLNRDKETEADIISGDVIINHLGGSMSATAFEYEKMVGEVLTELGVPHKSDSNEYDFIVNHQGKEVIVEVKMYRKLLGLGTARNFLNTILASGKTGILVVSSGVTQRTKELIQEHNQISDNQKILLVIGDSKEKVKKQLSEIFRV
ncbi:restriction endonuclease [Shewanella sp. NKUCC01_JLK]|uniref:restriction endonuclease n=1 Tax=Shewanella sp. NKUCC01_JLK TaxID=2842123 RepID=UPI001C5BDAE7|nr:restriction endonuclease [Shewanella sp. NKUCC01_JLK]MBW3513123.1 restriction endonuclease [Shewanella sp. NKUCC01_JLK]